MDWTCAGVGATGGAGTTRLTLECVSLLAGTGLVVAVLDAAYATQGLTDRTPGRIHPEVTALCLEGRFGGVAVLVERLGPLKLDVLGMLLAEPQREERAEAALLEQRRAAEPADDGLLVGPADVP